MIEVVKSGFYKNNKRYKNKCNKCNCEYSFEANDLIENYNLQNDYRLGSIYCPECSYIEDLYMSSITEVY